MVIKRDGRHEPFDRHKLYNGIAKACEKRPINLEQLDRTVDSITQELEANFGREVSTKEIGAKVMDRLHGIDDVAYVRYASVYRQFQDVGEFLDEIEMLERRPKPNGAQPELFG